MMARYKCGKCGLEFDECEIEHAREEVGEWCGMPAYESEGKCPRCGKSNFYEVGECEICGEVQYVDDMTACVCDDCLYKHKYDIDLCERIGQGTRDVCKINGFFASIFTEEEIDQILKDQLTELSKHRNIDCTAFIDGDKWFFAEALKGNGGQDDE